MEHVNIHHLSGKGVGLPADHPRGKRACLPYCVDATSHIDQFFQSIDMHFTHFYISFSELRVIYDQGLVLIIKQQEKRVLMVVSHLDGRQGYD